MSGPRSKELMNKNSQHEFRFTSQDRLQIACTRWKSRGPARGVTQIAHGLGEHSGRYSELILAAGSLLANPLSLSGIRRPDLAMYLFSGSEGPIGQQLQGIRPLIERYRQAGLRNISHDFYQGGRHEMLNELNCGQVRTNILLSSVLHDQSRNREALCPR